MSHPRLPSEAPRLCLCVPNWVGVYAMVQRGKGKTFVWSETLFHGNVVYGLIYTEDFIRPAYGMRP
jgi:hypothetical protein